MEPAHGIGARPQSHHFLMRRAAPAETFLVASRQRAGIGTRLQAVRARLCLALALIGVCSPLSRAFDTGQLGFSVAYKDESSRYRVNAVFLMPGETLKLKVQGHDTGSFIISDPAQRAQATGPRQWSWTAPDSSGLYPFKISGAAGGDTMFFNAFVMVPASEMRGEYLRGYRIGKYPKAPLRGLAFYARPQGFIQLDSSTQSTPISPHFRLGQFACKQTTALPAYLALKERLILKLELILEKANQAGWACETFHVMSGYRTPFYNHLIGNVKLSAHQYGGAADIFIDSDPEDGEMDDLNGDGRSDGDDSELLFKLVDDMSLNEFYLPFIGGIGKYSKNESHGAFVHVDVRGFRAIW